MSIFKPVDLIFKGTNYSVPANKVFGLIEAIESQVTMADLSINPKNTALARAYHAGLTYAGCSCGVEDVYQELFNRDGSTPVATVINQIMLLMIPPEHLNLPQGDEGKKEKGES